MFWRILGTNLRYEEVRKHGKNPIDNDFEKSQKKKTLRFSRKHVNLVHKNTNWNVSPKKVQKWRLYSHTFLFTVTH